MVITLLQVSEKGTPTENSTAMLAVSHVDRPLAPGLLRLGELRLFIARHLQRGAAESRHRIRGNLGGFWAVRRV